MAKEGSLRRDIWLLVTAHPDDESMFFIPTLRNLIKPTSEDETGGDAAGAAVRGIGPPLQPTRRLPDTPAIHALCLSNGDYRDVSDGPIRANEMHRACTVIGIPSGSKGNESVVTVLNDDRMKDGPNEVWSPDLVSETVLDHIRRKVLPSAVRVQGGASRKPHQGYMLSPPPAEAPISWVYMKGKTRQPSATGESSAQAINLRILTFDKGGVSGHPNHVDVFRGMQFLLNERCNITRDEVGSRAMLRLCTKANGSSKEEDVEDIVQLNVEVHTLRTISNPLQKYFLWALMDMVPFLVVWCVQASLCLLYFLLGGLLWGKASPRIRPFAGTRAVHCDKCTQYRVMEPLLVWAAMAAHHSQFVWYRRLSVMFSRYTYINDVHKLHIGTPPTDGSDDDDDDCAASLPPVATVKEDDSSPKFLLTQMQMNALREAVLPPALHHRRWKRIYSLSRDGDSFVAFQKLLEDWNMSQGGESTILVVKTSAGDLIGGYADAPIIPLASSPVGSAAKSCLFKMNTGVDCDEPIAEVYGKQYASSKRLVFDVPRRIIAFGGGDTDGGLDEGFGLCLEDGFARGTTSRCAAFRNEPLVSGKDGVFDVLDVEVWGFVFGQF